MRKILLATLCFLPFSIMAQTLISEEDFDAYAGDSLLEPQSAEWEGWYLNVTPTLVSTDYARSGSNSMKVWVDGNQPGTDQNETDVVHHFGDLTTGRYEMRFYQYVPSDDGTGTPAGGYFNMLHFYNTAQQNNTEWAFEVYVNPSSATDQGVLRADGEEIGFDLTYDAWVEYVIEVDLDQSMTRVDYDGTTVQAFRWTSQPGGEAGQNQLAAMNLYAACWQNFTGACEPLVYYDDFTFTETTGVGIEEARFEHQLTVYPNPSAGVFNFKVSDNTSNEITFRVVDLMGKEVWKSVDVSANNGTYQRTLDLSGLAQGVYSLMVDDGEKVGMKKIVIR